MSEPREDRRAAAAHADPVTMRRRKKVHTPQPMLNSCALRSVLQVSLLVIASSGCVASQRELTADEKAASRMGSDVTIWEHTALADDIVLADVGPTRDESRLFGSPWMITSLAVRETWKGAGDVESVGRSKAIYGGFAPGNPRRGSRAIIFISRRRGESELLEVRHPSSAEDAAQYRTVIGAALALQNAGKGINREWMMLAARTRATRWDGLSSIGWSQVRLTAAESQSLAAAFLLEPSVDAGVGLTMSFLQERSIELDDAFASSIDATIASDSSWSEAVGLVDVLVAKRNCQVERRLYDPADPDSPKVERLTMDGAVPTQNRTGVLAWWQQVKRECGLHPRPVSGVGNWAALWLGRRPP